MTRVLRFVEENGDEVELGRLAQWLGVPDRRAFELLDVLTREGVFREGIVASVQFGYSRDEMDDDPLPDTVSLFRGRVDPRSPTRWRGMDQLGFFPYSLPETEDRLALIDEALAADLIADDLHPALHSARRKLGEWKCELQSREPMS